MYNWYRDIYDFKYRAEPSCFCGRFVNSCTIWLPVEATLPFTFELFLRFYHLVLPISLVFICTPWYMNCMIVAQWLCDMNGVILRHCLCDIHIKLPQDTQFGLIFFISINHKNKLYSSTHIISPLLPNGTSLIKPDFPCTWIVKQYFIVPIKNPSFKAIFSLQKW